MMCGNANANAWCQRKERTYNYLPVSAVKHLEVHDKSLFTPQVPNSHSGSLKSVIGKNIHIQSEMFNGKNWDI